MKGEAMTNKEICDRLSRINVAQTGLWDHPESFQPIWEEIVEILQGKPLAVVEGWIDPTAMSIKDEIRAGGGHVYVVAPMVLDERGKYYTQPVTVFIYERKPDEE